MKSIRFKANKLVRDCIPTIIRAQGVTVADYILDDIAYIASLKNKLIEEASEVQQATSRAELIEELADMYEVLNALQKATAMSSEEIEHSRKEKAVVKGAFNQKVFVDYFEMDQENPVINYYRARFKEYPEIEKN